MPETPATSESVPREKQSDRIIDNRVAVFTLMFAVMGFLAIPILLASRGFSAKEKLVWSVVITIYTLILIAITAAICMWCYRVLSNAGIV